MDALLDTLANLGWAYLIFGGCFALLVFILVVFVFIKILKSFRGL